MEVKPKVKEEQQSTPHCKMNFFFKEAETEFKDLSHLPRLHLKYQQQYNQKKNSQINLKFPWIQVVLRIALFLQVIAYPFAIKHLFSNLSNSEVLPRYITLVCLLGLFRVFFRTQAIWLQFQLQVSIRKVLCKQISESAIYGDAHDNSATWNLINSDSHVAIGYFESKQELCFQSAKLIFGIFYLYNTFNSAIFYGIGVVLLLTSTISYASKRIVKLTDELCNIRDSKFKIITLLLERIREIKMCRLENYFNGKIKEVRGEQFQNLKLRKMWDTICVGTWQLTHVVLSFSVLTIYLKWYEGKIDFEVESILYILEMLIMPLNGLPWYFSGLTKAKEALNRVNEFIRTHLKVEVKNIEYNQELPPSLVIDEPGKISIIDLQVEKIRLEQGKVYCLQAPAKVGKSVFLKSLLGMFPSTYHCIINGKIGYVDQKLFHLQNSMGSITSSLDLNHDKMKQNQQIKDLLVRFHCLEMPLENLTSTYSGGEKLRLALVRAFYQNDVIIIDSDLNSLDKKVRKYIEHQLLIIAEEMRKIVLIASNNSISQNIITIQSGRIYQTTNPNPNKYILPEHQSYKDTYFASNHLELSPKLTPSVTSNTVSAPQYQKPQLKHFLFYYKNFFQHSVFIISIIILFYLKNYFKLFINNNISDTDFIQRFTVITILYILAVFLRSYYFATANLAEAKRIGEKVLDVISFGNIEFYESYGKEVLATRALSDMETVDSQFSFEMNILFNNIFEMLFKMGVLVWSFFPMIVPVFIFMIDFYKNFFRYRKVSKFLQQNSNRVSERLLESVTILSEGKILIKGMKQQQKYLQIFNQRLDDYINNKACISAQDRRFAQRFFLITQILMLLALIITYFFRDSISSTDTHIKLAMTAMIGVTDYFGWFSKSVVTCQNVSYTLKRQSDCVESVGHVNSERMNQKLKQEIRERRGVERLDIKDLKFRYEKEGEYILNNLTLCLQKDDRILIRGKTGSGKTTLFKILTGLYPQSSPAAKLFESQFISFSPQKPLILPGSLKQNIDPYNIFTEDELEEHLNKFTNKKVEQLTNTQQLLVNKVRAEVYGESSVSIYDEPLVVPEKGTMIIVSHHGEFEVKREYELLGGKLELL